MPAHASTCRPRRETEMAKHLYLPPVTSDANLNEPAHIGQWEQNEPRILNALSQGLSVDEKAKSRGVSSVPDVWARPLTFQSAIRPASHHPLKKQLLNEWRCLMSLLALREVYAITWRSSRCHWATTSLPRPCCVSHRPTFSSNGTSAIRGATLP